MFTFLQSVQVLQHTALLILSQHDIHAGDIGHRSGLKLTIATCHDNIGIGIFTDNLVDSLAALLVGHLGNRAGIDNADIGLLATHSLMCAGFYQLTHNGRCLREVKLTTQSIERGALAFK